MIGSLGLAKLIGPPRASRGQTGAEQTRASQNRQARQCKETSADRRGRVDRVERTDKTEQGRDRGCKEESRRWEDPAIKLARCIEEEL